MAIILKEQATALTAIIERSEGKYVAFCPELDLVTEGDTPELAVDDLIDMAIDYAEQYMAEYQVFSQSANRASHASFVHAIHELRAKDRVKTLFT